MLTFYAYFTITFYISPKIHKENNPGRPVINSINYHISEISPFVDHDLQPLGGEIPSYIKDTTDFINKINNFPVLPDYLLLIVDLKSLYASISNDKKIDSVKKKYDHYAKKTMPNKIITTSLTLILTLNNFIFNSKILFTEKKLCYWNHLRPFICEYLHFRIRRKICLPSNQK